jgi:hypothetical protein
VRAVVAAPCSAVDLVHYTGIALVEVELAVDDLIEEGLLTEDTAGHFSIAD